MCIFLIPAYRSNAKYFEPLYQPFLSALPSDLAEEVDKITKRVHEEIIIPVLMADHGEFLGRFNASVLSYQNHVVALALNVLSYHATSGKLDKFLEKLERLELDSHEILLEFLRKSILRDDSHNAMYALETMIDWERFVVKKIRSQDFAKSFTIPQYIDMFKDLMPLALTVQCLVTCAIIGIADENVRLNVKKLAMLGGEYARKVKPMLNSLTA